MSTPREQFREFEAKAKKRGVIFSGPSVISTDPVTAAKLKALPGVKVVSYPIREPAGTPPPRGTSSPGFPKVREETMK